MAFVVRSERKIELDPFEKNDVGPGQYIQVRISQNENSNKTQTKQENVDSLVDKYKIKIEETPGPGSYNLQHSKSVHNLSRLTNSNCSTVELNNSNHKHVKINGGKFGFLTKVGRFQDRDNNDCSIPGPGQYLIRTDSSGIVMRKKSSPRNNKSNSSNYFLSSSKHVVSIPPTFVLKPGSENIFIGDSMSTCSGTTYNNPNIEEIKVKGNTRSESRGEIGPGSYDLSSNWSTNIVEWKKSLNSKEHILRNQKKIEHSIIEEIKRQGDFIPHFPHTNPYMNRQLLLFNQLNQRNHLNVSDLSNIRKYPTRRSNSNSNCSNGERLMSYFQSNDNPGPGYYLKENDWNSINGADNDDCNENNHRKSIIHPLRASASLLSMSNREHMKDKEICSTMGGASIRFKDDFFNGNINENIGPTSYFIQKNKYDIGNKPYNQGVFNERIFKPNEIVIKAVKKQHQESKEKNGPGSYNIAGSFIKKSSNNNSIELISSGSKRFDNAPCNKKDINNLPGPGAYLDQNILSKEIQKKIIIASNIDKDMEREKDLYISSLVKEREKDMSPSVHSYKPEVLNSIKYQIESKFNQRQSNYAPFQFGTCRFEKEDNKRKKVSPGPGAYEINKEKDIERINKDKNFNVNDKRFKEIGDKNIVGPADYDLLKNMDWDKKSFNVLFLNSEKKI